MDTLMPMFVISLFVNILAVRWAWGEHRLRRELQEETVRYKKALLTASGGGGDKSGVRVMLAGVIVISALLLWILTT